MKGVKKMLAIIGIIIITIIVSALFSGLEALPTAGILYLIFTKWTALTAWTYGTWFLIAFAILFIFNLFLRNSNNSKG